MPQKQPSQRRTPNPAEQQQGPGVFPLDPANALSLWERSKYTAGTALAIGGLAELIGFGSLALLLAAAGGVAGCVFSDELHQFVLNHLPAPKQARGSRQSRMHWWLTGEALPESEELDEEADDEGDENDEEWDDDPDDKEMGTGDMGEVHDDQPVSPASGKKPRRNVLAKQEFAPDAVQLAPDLALPLQEIAGRAIFIVGMRRSGKTTLGVRIAEELAGHYIPLFWPDLEGDCLSMVDMLPRGKVAGHPDSYDPRGELAYAFEPVTVDSAYLLGYTTLEEGWQVVLDMGSYQSVEEACQVIVQVIAGLFAWANQHPGLKVPSLVALDEAQRFLPERLADSIIKDKSVLEALLKAYMDIIAVGGKRGISPLILTQRFAQVNKKIMAQSELFFILKQTMDKDLERCMEFVKRRTATEEQISQFQQGEGVYIGLGGEQFVTRFFKRHSDGSRSHTPQAEAARRYAEMPMRRGIGTGAPPQQQPPMNQGAVPGIQVAPPKAAPSLLEQGVTAYLHGATSQPKLAVALGISAWEARNLMPQVQAEVKRREDAQAEMSPDDDPDV